MGKQSGIELKCRLDISEAIEVRDTGNYETANKYLGKRNQGWRLISVISTTEKSGQVFEKREYQDALVGILWDKSEVKPIVVEGENIKIRYVFAKFPVSYLDDVERLRRDR